MTLIFPPCGPAPEDSITPSEAVNLLAGVQSTDPWNPLAYEVADEELDKANERLFDALVAGDIAGVALTEDGSPVRVPVGWVDAHRTAIETFRDGEWGLASLRVVRLPDTIEPRRGQKVPDQVLGRPWFVARALVERLANAETAAACEPTPSRMQRGFARADEPLVKRMHELFETGQQPSLRAAARWLASEAKGGGTPESKADRIYRQRRRDT